VEEWYMKRFLVGLMVAAVAAIGFGSVAASASANKLQTFGTGTVTITGADSATIVNGPGEFGGVYINSKSQNHKPLGEVSFSFVSTGDVTGGAPRFSIPIDTDGVGGTVEGYAFLDVLGCGYSTGMVSTELPNCHVNFQSVDYANWDAFAAANPTYRIARGAVSFIIADEPGSYAVNSIDLR
jgi:hypothetical protein